MNPDFEVLLKEAGDLEARKRADYGRTDDKYANYRSAEAWGIPAYVTVATRIDEKLARVRSFVANGKLENEPIEDAFLDIAVCALIALDLYRQEHPSNAMPLPFNRKSPTWLEASRNADPAMSLASRITVVWDTNEHSYAATLTSGKIKVVGYGSSQPEAVRKAFRIHKRVARHQARYHP